MENWKSNGKEWSKTSETRHGVKCSNGVLRHKISKAEFLSKMKMTISGRITIFVKFFTEGFKLALVSRYSM